MEDFSNSAVDERQNTENVNSVEEKSEEKQVDSFVEEFHSKQPEELPTKEKSEKTLVNEEYTQNEDINNEEVEELNFEDMLEDSKNGEEESLVLKKPTEQISFKRIIIIILQITFVITISVLQYLYHKLENLWKNTSEKAKEIYEKEQIQKYVKDANETYERLNINQKFEQLKDRVQETYDSKKKDLIKVFQSNVKSVMKILPKSSLKTTESK